jgi:hypothetical protein
MFIWFPTEMFVPPATHPSSPLYGGDKIIFFFTHVAMIKHSKVCATRSILIFHYHIAIQCESTVEVLESVLYLLKNVGLQENLSVTTLLFVSDSCEGIHLHTYVQNYT